MKKTPILFLAIMLSVATCVHAQQIADVLAKNDGGMLQTVATGTDVRSTSLRLDRPTFVPQDFMYHAGGRTCAARPYGGPPDVHTTTFHVPCRGTSVPAVSQQSIIPDWLSCGDNDIAKRKGEKPLSILSNTDSCSNAFGAVFQWEQNLYNLDSAYDTMQWYIRHCYPNAEASQTWGAYQGSWGDTLNYPGIRDSIFNFVLYGLGLRSDDEWFCFGVPLLEVKYVNPGNDEPEFPAIRAILQFLMNNPRCAEWRRSDSTQQADLLTEQWGIWSDTSHRGEVFDSTVPTLQQLGLDTLLSFAAVANYTTLGSQIILNASITENPFDNSTAIALSVGRESYITIAVYNVLGQQIAGAGYAGVFEQGSATVPVNMASAPPGAYLVRISTANNEVQTLKLTKE